MQRIGYLIAQVARRHLSQMENNPSSHIFNLLVGHQLYGLETDNGQEAAELETRLNEMAMLERLRAEPAEFWCRIFNSIFQKVSGAVCKFAMR